jgi:D-alanyl-D-alanine carboxypeptidase
MSAREDNMGIGAVEFRSRSDSKLVRHGGLATAAILTTLGVALVPSAENQAQASVRAAIVLDQNTGRVYKSYNANVRHKPASLTKMMTLYLVFDALKAKRLRLNQWVRVSYRAASRPPSKMYLRAGQRISIRHLIYGMAVKSANDAATAAAEAVAGSEARFARMMTMKARELGMFRTVFRTASGLPAAGQITTARDMAVLARALRRDHPYYYRVFAARYFRYRGRLHGNTNRLLHRSGVVDGLKTGYTRRARYNLATSATNGRKRVVVVVLGASSSRERYRVTRNLLAFAWRARPYGGFVVARAARNHFRHRSNRTRMMAMARASAKRNAAKKTGSSLVIQKKTLAVRTAERRRHRIQLGTSRAYAATAPRTKVATYRRVQVLHLGSYRHRRTASRKAVRAYRRLPARYRHGAKIRVAVVRTRKGRRYRAQIARFQPRRTGTACRYLKRRGTSCRIITYKTRTLAAATLADWRARHAPTRPAARSKRRQAGSGYSIQVAASHKLGLARKAIRKARRALPRSIVNGTHTAVLRPSSYKGRLFRARIVGLSKQEARKACRILANRKLRCIAIRHSA